MLKQTNTKKRFTKKVVLISIAAVLVLGGGVAVAYQKITEDDKPPEVTTPVDTPGFTDEALTDDEKQALIERNEQRVNPTPTEGKRAVTPVITSAIQSGSEITVSAYVSGIVEEGGKCILTATKGSLSVTKTVNGVVNATTTNCPPFILNTSEFPETGDWSATVTYDSANASGVSQSKAFTVK